MTVTIYADDRFEQDTVQVRECPHCGAHAQMLPVSTPRFETLQQTRAGKVPVGYLCSACGEPRFARAHVRSIDSNRIELAEGIVEIERPREHFAFSYLPEDVRVYFDEALQCYAADIFNAFAAMCRLTVAASMDALDDRQQTLWRSAFDEIVHIGQIDDATAATMERLLFSGDAVAPLIDAGQAAVLLEIVKDILYQVHVRAARFRAAMKVRRFFAEEQSGKLTTLRRPRGAGLGS
ncbi:MAG TPA: hypothetical protein VKQ06_09935 [Gammaproteobacteria bacterium]|nr:hypothetical protein [Gammaproteobacteria bacterium]